MTKTRIEKDSMGTLEVPINAIYGAQTQRAINNFPVSGKSMPEQFVRALILVKRSAALANIQLECLSEEQGNAIVNACDELLDQDENLMSNFPVDIFQTGSGTSSNMNANEVIANKASAASGININPNDHVNYGQSSNDVIPTTIHVSASLALNHDLLPALNHLISVIKTRASELSDYCKTGRTHLMDAMPVTMEQSLNSWASQLYAQVTHLEGIKPLVLRLAQGGTAVGTGINAHPDFANIFNEKLRETTGLSFKKGDNFFSLIGSQDTAVSLSGATKSVAVTLMKIANDLRWMNSGPLAGLGEIALPALQPGSSIMPGKVNPVIPESVAMVSAQVIGNDTAITIGGQSGNFELNVMLPMIAANLLDNLQLLTSASHILADKAIAGFTVNEENLTNALHKNPILVTALNPIIGYAKAAEIAKKAYKEGRPIIDVAEQETDLPRSELEELLDPTKLTMSR